MYFDKNKLSDMLVGVLVASRRGPLERLLGIRKHPTSLEYRIARGIAAVVCKGAPESLVSALRSYGVPTSKGYRLNELLSKNLMTSSEEKELNGLISGSEIIVLEE
jgi:hypothetical protein